MFVEQHKLFCLQIPTGFAIRLRYGVSYFFLLYVAEIVFSFLRLNNYVYEKLACSSSKINSKHVIKLMENKTFEIQIIGHQ